MKYWKQNGHEYVLSAQSKMTGLRLAVGVLCIGLAVAAKVLAWHNAAFWGLLVFGALCVIAAFARKGQRIAIDSAAKTFLYPSSAVGLGMQALPLHAFLRFEVHKAEYMRFPLGVDVHVLFLDGGREKRFLLKSKGLTHSSAWAQELIDETEALIHQYKD